VHCHVRDGAQREDSVRLYATADAAWAAFVDAAAGQMGARRPGGRGFRWDVARTRLEKPGGRGPRVVLAVTCSALGAGPDLVAAVADAGAEYVLCAAPQRVVDATERLANAE